MKIDIDDLYDMISVVRMKVYEDELSAEEALDLLEKKISNYDE